MHSTTISNISPASLTYVHGKCERPEPRRTEKAMFFYQVQYLVISAAGAEAKDEQVPVRVCTGEVLPIWRALTVKQRPVPLTLNLKSTRIKHTVCGVLRGVSHLKAVNRTTKT